MLFFFPCHNCVFSWYLFCSDFVHFFYLRHNKRSNKVRSFYDVEIIPQSGTFFCPSFVHFFLFLARYYWRRWWTSIVSVWNTVVFIKRYFSLLPLPVQYPVSKHTGRWAGELFRTHPRQSASWQQQPMLSGIVRWKIKIQTM